MPYRQIWDNGHAHATELRQQAALERARREAARPRHSLSGAVATFVRRTAGGLERIADRLEPRTIRGRHATHTVSSRPGGA